MEGDGGEGESIVAIIEGLRGRGLAVTLMRRAHHPNGNGAKYLPLSKSSVETRTDGRHKQNASAQICDGRYTSSYQLAHCRLTPTPTGSFLGEFPPQRHEPSRTNGNFEVGGRRDGFHSPTQTYRGEIGHASRSLYSTCPSPSLPSDAFIDSLRKYPFAPDRSVSTELVQRLLIYTQAKHLTRNSSRSMRSLREKGSRQSRLIKESKENRSTRDVRVVSTSKMSNNANKDVQTYTRARNDKTGQKDVVKSGRGYKTSHDSKLKMEQLCETYNYLKASCSERPSNIGRGSEVRYLNDVKRCIRRAIRGMVESSPIACPNIQRRYSAHRKSHLDQRPATAILNQDGKVDEGQCTSRTDCAKLKSCVSPHSKPKAQQCNISSECPNAKSWADRQYWKFCDRESLNEMAAQECPSFERRQRTHIKTQHPYGMGSGRMSSDSQGQQTSRSRYCAGFPRLPSPLKLPRLFHRSPCICKTRTTLPPDKRMIRTDEPTELEMDILEWLNDLPVHANDLPENAVRRQEMVKHLADKLNDVIDQDDYNERAREEVNTFIDRIPIWYPENKQERTMFKNHISDTLFEKVRRYRNLKEVVTDWLNNINFEFLGSYGKNMNKNTIVKEFVDLLEPILDQPKDKLKREILKKLPKVADRLRKLVDDIANKLVAKVDRFVSQLRKRGERYNRKLKIPLPEQYIWNLLAHAANISEDDVIANRKLVQEFCQELNELQSDKADDDTIEKEIRNFLDILQRNGIQINLKDKEQLVVTILSDIKSNNQDKKSRNYSDRSTLEQPISENFIWDWLENATSVPEETKRKNQRLVRNFCTKLNNLQAQNAGDHVIENEIKKFLDVLPEEGIEINPKDKNKLVRKLLNDISPEKKSQLQQKPLSEESVWNRLESMVDVPEDVKRKNKKFIKAFIEKLNDFQEDNADGDVIEQEIKDFVEMLLERGIEIDPKDKNKLVKNLLNDIKAEQKPQTQQKPISEESVWNRLESMVDVPEDVKRKNEKIVKAFIEKLNDLQEDNADDDVIKQEIKDFVDMLSERGIEIDSKDKNKLVRKLLNDINSKQKPEIQEKPLPLSEKTVWNRLENMVDVPEDIKRKNKKIVKAFVEKFNDLQQNNADDDVIEQEIKVFVDMLSERGIEIDPNDKNKLVKNLLNDIKAEQKPQTQQKPISEESVWNRLESMVDVPEDVKRKNEKIVKGFIEKLNDLQEDNADDDVIKQEIKDFVDMLSERGIEIDPNDKNKLVRKLLNDINSKQKPEIQEKPLPLSEKTVWNRLENMVDVPEDIKRKNKKIVKAFVEKFNDLQENNADDDVIEQEIKVFVDMLSERGIEIDPNDKNKLVKNLLNDIKAEQKPQTQQKPLSEKTVWNRLENMVDVPEDIKRKNKKIVKAFVEKFNDLQENNADDDVIEQEIKDFLDMLLERGIEIDPKDKNKLVRNFLKDIKAEQKPQTQQKPLSEESVWNRLESMVDVPEDVKRKTKKFVKAFAEKLNDLQEDNADDDVIEQKIKEFVDILPERGIEIDPKDKNKLVRNFLNDIKAEQKPISEESVWNRLESMVDVPKDVKRKNKKIVKAFTEKLNDLKEDKASDDVIEQEIRDFVGMLPERGININPKETNKLIIYILDDVKSNYSPSENETDEPPWNKLERVSDEAYNENKLNTKYSVENYKQKSKVLPKIKIDKDFIKQEGKDPYVSTIKGILVNSNYKLRSDSNLVNNVRSKPGSQKQQKSLSEESTWNWLERAADVPEDVKRKNKDLIKNFTQRLKDLQDENADEDTIKQEIRDFLDVLPRKGIEIDPRDKNKLIKELLNDVRSKPASQKNQKQQKPLSEKSTWDWLESAADVPEVVKRKNKDLIKNFTQRLKDLRDENADEDTIKQEITDFLDVLPRKGIEIDPRDKNKLIKELLNDVLSKPASKKQQKQQKPLSEKSTWDWLESAADVPEVVKKKNKDLIKNFTQRLKDLRDENADEDTIKQEITDFLDELPRKGIEIDPKDKNRLVNELLNDVRLEPVSQKQQKQQKPFSEKSTWDWLESAADVPEDVKRKNKDLIKNFTQRLKDLQDENADEDTIKQEVRDFLDVLPRKGIEIDPRDKNKLIKELLNDVFSKPASKKQQKQQKPLSEKSTWDWLERAEDVPEDVKKKKKNLIKNFTQRLKDLQDENADEDIIKQEVTDFLDVLPRKGIEIDPRDKNKLVNELLNDVRSEPVSQKQQKQQKPFSEKSTWDWLESAADVPEDVKRKNKDLIKNFTQRLKDLQDENADEDTIKQEIRDFLDALPRKGIEIDPRDKNKLIKELLNDVRSKPASQKQQKQQKPLSEKFTWDWLESAADVPEVVKRKNKDLIKNFTQRLKDLRDENADEDTIKQEIRDFLDVLPRKGIKINSRDKNRLFNELLNDVRSEPVSQKQPKQQKLKPFIPKQLKILTSSDEDPFQEAVSEQSVWDQLENVTNVPENIKKQNQNLVKGFIRKLNNLKSENADKDVIKKEVNEFLDTLPQKGIQINPKDEDKLVRNLLNGIKSEPKEQNWNKGTTTIDFPGKRKSGEFITEQLVWDWLGKAVDVPENIKKKNKKMVSGFVKKINDLKSANVDDDDIEEEIRDFLDILSLKGLKIEPKIKGMLVKKLLVDLNLPRPRKRLRSFTLYPDMDETGFIQPISDRSNWVVKNVRHTSKDVKQKNLDLIKDFQQKIKDLQSANVSDDDIAKEIREFIDALPKKGVQVISDDTEVLVKNILHDLKSQPKTQKHWEQKNQNLNTESLIKHEISEILDDIPINVDPIKRKNIKNNIANVLASIDRTLLNDDATKRKIAEILMKEKLPRQEATDLANALINRVKGMPMSDSSNIITEPDSFNKMTEPVYPSTSEKRKLEKNIENEILDLIEYVNGDYDPKTRNLRKKTAGPLAQKLVAVLTDPTIKDKDSRIKEEFSRYLDKSSTPTDELIENLERQLQNQVQNIGLKTSTPSKKAKVKSDRLSAINYFAANSGPKPKKQTMPYNSRSSSSDDIAKDLLFTPKEYLVGETSLETDDANYSKKKRGTKRLQNDEFGNTASKRNQIPKGTQRDDFDSDDTDDYVSEKKKSPERSQNSKFDSTASKPKQVPIELENDSYENVVRPQALLKYSIVHMSDSDLSPEDEKRPSQDSENGLRSNPKVAPTYARNRESEDASILYDEEKHMGKLVNIIKSWIDYVGISVDSLNDSSFIITMANDLAGDILDRQKKIQENSGNINDKDEVKYLKYQIYKWLHKFVDMEDLTPMEPDIKSLMNSILKNEVPQLVKFNKNNNQNEMKVIKDIISKWIKDIHPNVFSAVDINTLNSNISELAESIQKILLDNEIGDANIRDVISEWINPINIDEDDLIMIADDLKSLLSQSGLTEPSGIRQDTSEFVGENLKGAILDWLKALPIYKKRNSQDKRMQESLVDDLTDGIKSIFKEGPSNDIDKRLIKEIKRHLRQFPMEPELQSNDGFIQTLAEHLLDYLKHLQLFQDISQRESEDLLLNDEIKGNVDEWTNNLPLSKMNSSENLKLENLKAKLSARIRQLQQTELNNESKLKKEIKEYLKTLPMENGIKKNQKLLDEFAEQLINKLKQSSGIDQHPEPTTVSDDYIKMAVSHWIKKLNIPKSDEPYIKDIISKAEKSLISNLEKMFINTDKVPLETIKANVQKATCQFLEKIPVNPYRVQDIKPIAGYLLNMIKEYSKYPTKPTIKKAADVMLDVIKDWSENLPIKADTLENKERAKKTKDQIENKLIHKIGELNMNPEVFNDDYLYENMLEDEVDDLFTNILNGYIKEPLFDCLKKDLINKVKAARQMIQEENAGQIYKQHLVDAISKYTPSEMSEDEQASFNLLKDNVADAFINMHFVGGDEEAKNKLQIKVLDEINKFTNDYLRKHPASPIDTQRLNENLYNALKNVLEPNNESLQNEAELVKIKEIVKDWASELPMNEQTGKEKLKTNQMLSVLAKKLHDIEKEQERFPGMNYDKKMKKDIIKFMKKLPLTNKKDEDINQFADKLIKSLKDSEELLKFNTSYRFSIDTYSECFCYTPVVPPCTLSLEDRLHLQMIRNRTPRESPFKDLSVSPVDASSQTTFLRNPVTGVGRNPMDSLPQQSSSVQTPAQRMQAVGSQVNISPHVLVKEYYWDSVDDADLNSTATCDRNSRQLPCGSRSQRTITPRDSGQMTTPRPCMAPGSPCSLQSPQAQSYITTQSSVPCRTQEQNLSSSQKNPPGCRYSPFPSSFAPRFTPRFGSERKNICKANQYSTSNKIPCSRTKPEQFQIPEDSHYESLMSQQPNESTTPFKPRQCMDATVPCLPPNQGPPCANPQGSPQADPCGSQYRITFSPNQEPPCYKRQEAPPISSDDFERQPSRSSLRKPRVTRLGSLDHMNPKACSSRRFDWEKFHGDDFQFYERDSKRRCLLSDDDFDEMYIKEKEENIRCRCRERSVSKCKGNRRCNVGPAHNEAKNCRSKCGVSGMHCPHPSHMCFRH